MVSHGRADLNFVIVDPVLMSGSIGTDAVAKAFCKDFLLLNVNELVFQRRRPRIDYEYVHGLPLNRVQVKAIFYPRGKTCLLRA